MAHQSYLLLGEGDFTYSLDMTRYLRSLSIDDNKAAGGASPPSISIACTGVDTIQELRDKYKDVDFVLRNIRSTGSVVEASVWHGVNAVQAERGDEEDGCDAIRRSFDRVLFHHPHLGTEDARLHSRFLRHLFHAASKRWMRPRTGLLHLTLVDGQCKRWKCLEGATRHGLVLLGRGAFCAPPPPKSEGGKDDSRTYYSLRRHQSGKSFAGRRRMPGEGRADARNDSETLVFGRSCDYPTNDIADVGLLPWETPSRRADAVATRNNAGETGTATAVSASETSSNAGGDPHPCPHCSKSFRERRSLKNHVVCSHPDCDEVRAWKSEKGEKKTRKRKSKDDERTECLGVGPGARRSDERRSDVDVGGRRAPGDGPVLVGPPWTCDICAGRPSPEQPARTFPHMQSLLDHRRAKHLGAHLDIKPDWYGDGIDETGGAEGGDIGPGRRGDAAPAEPPPLGTCPVCDLPYSTELDRLRHEMEFVPSPSVIENTMSQTSTNTDALRNNDRRPAYKCSHCSKTFKDLRAQRQHENCCSPQGPLQNLGNETERHDMRQY